MRRSRAPLLSAVAAAVALTLAACASSAKTSASSSTTQPLSASSASSNANPTSADAATAGDIPDNQVYVAYVDAAGPFTVKVPEGWSRTESSGTVTFTDKLNSIRLDVSATATTPTPDSATAVEVPAIAATAKSYQPGKVTKVTRLGGDAVLITYRADSAPDPVTGKVVHQDVERYEFWRNGKEAILTLSGPVGADNVDPWKIVTDSFGWQ
jgi:hypothetical protein